MMLYGQSPMKKKMLHRDSGLRNYKLFKSLEDSALATDPNQEKAMKAG